MPNPDYLSGIVALISNFSALAGVATLVAAIVNILKSTPLVKDGDAPRWYAGLSLVVFSALVYFNVFQGVDLMALNTTALQVSGILAFLGVYISQLGLGMLAHSLLKPLRIPGVSTSLSEPKQHDYF